MSRFETLREGISRRLAVAVGEILGLFEKTISEYEENVSRLQEENNGQRELLDAVLRPRVVLHRGAFPPQLQRLPRQQQEWSPSLVHEEPGPPRRRNRGLRVGQEAGITHFPFPPVTVKTERDKEWSQLHQSQTEGESEAEPVAGTSTEQKETEADGDDWGVLEATSSSDPAAGLQPAGFEQLFSPYSSDVETLDSDEDWKVTREPQSVLPPDLRQLSVYEEELSPEQQEWSPCLGQEEPGPPHIKVEEEELCVSQEAGITQFPFPPVPVKETRKPWSGSHHRKRHPTRRGNKLYNCEHCGKSLLTSSEIIVHRRVHTGEKPFPCEQCGKKFSQLGNLKRHQRTHTGEKPYPCEQCGKKFSHLANLKKHRLVHTGEKPYPCEQCGKRFNQVTNLKVHQCLHRGEKPYSCEQCGKRFSQLTSLKNHQHTHTGQKPYPCEQCGKRFTQSTNLRIHQRTHTGKKPTNQLTNFAFL